MGVPQRTPSTSEAPSHTCSSLQFSAQQRFPKSSRFTDSIVVHGRWENNTLDEATNLRQRKHRLQERTTLKMKEMSQKFRWEVEEIERIQEIVRMRQRRLARANLRTCCAIAIQATWRRHHVTVVARRQRGTILGEMLLRWWRRFKVRRSLAAVQLFILTRIIRRREQSQKQLKATRVIQRAWRRRLVRQSVGHLVTSSAAIEEIVENTWRDLVFEVHVERMVRIIIRAWKRRRRRRGGKHRKESARDRTFLTQSNGPVIRRKFRGVNTRTGIASDPSSGSTRGNGYSTSQRGIKGRHSPPVPAPSMLSVVVCASAAGGGGGSSNEEPDSLRRPPLSRSNSSSHREGILPSTAPAVSASRISGSDTVRHGANEGGLQQNEIEDVSINERLPLAKLGYVRLSSTGRPPYATVSRSGSDDGDVYTDASLDNLSPVSLADALMRAPLPMADTEGKANTQEEITTPEPRRPSSEKRSKLLTGRAHAFVSGEGRRSTAAPSQFQALEIKPAPSSVTDGDSAATLTRASFDPSCMDDARVQAPDTTQVGTASAAITGDTARNNSIQPSDRKSPDADITQPGSSSKALVSSNVDRPTRARGVDECLLAEGEGEVSDARAPGHTEYTTKNEAANEYANDTFESDGEVSPRR